MNIEGLNGALYIDAYLEWGGRWKKRIDMIFPIKCDGLRIGRGF
jgi:hypothetical protein